jgi:hypothetical protein
MLWTWNNTTNNRNEPFEQMNQNYVDLCHIGSLTGPKGLLIGSPGAQQAVQDVCQERFGRLQDKLGLRSSKMASKDKEAIWLEFAPLSKPLSELIEESDRVYNSHKAKHYMDLIGKLEKPSAEDEAEAGLERLAMKLQKAMMVRP